MAIDVLKEKILTLSEAASRLPNARSGNRPHVSVLWRWAASGKKCPDGTVARLDAVRISGTTCTSVEALQRFFRLTGEGPDR